MQSDYSIVAVRLELDGKLTASRIDFEETIVNCSQIIDDKVLILTEAYFYQVDLLAVGSAIRFDHPQTCKEVGVPVTACRRMQICNGKLYFLFYSRKIAFLEMSKLQPGKMLGKLTHAREVEA